MAALVVSPAPPYRITAAVVIIRDATSLSLNVAAVALGACCVERHITTDRAMWGSDQAASLEPNGITRVVRDIRLIEQSMGDGIKRVNPSEVPIIEKLRRVGASA